MSDALDDGMCLSHRNPQWRTCSRNIHYQRAQASKDLEDKDGHSARYHRHMRKRVCSADPLRAPSLKLALELVIDSRENLPGHIGRCRAVDTHRGFPSQLTKNGTRFCAAICA